jgi:hypothetical protein
MTKLEVLRMKAEISNCERIAERTDGSIKQALLDRAAALKLQLPVENIIVEFEDAVVSIPG